MGRFAQQLIEDRATRDAARATFDVRLAQIRQDLDARGVGGRIADKLGHDALDAFDEAVEIANQNRGIVAGTIAAVMIWLFRSPIIAWVEGLLGIEDESGDEKEAKRDRD